MERPPKSLDRQNPLSPCKPDCRHALQQTPVTISNIGHALSLNGGSEKALRQFKLRLNSGFLNMHKQIIMRTALLPLLLAKVPSALAGNALGTPLDGQAALHAWHQEQTWTTRHEIGETGLSDAKKAAVTSTRVPTAVRPNPMTMLQHLRCKADGNTLEMFLQTCER